MSESVSITMNTAEFSRVLARVAEESSRTYPQFLNGQGLRLASFAVRETQRANPDTIAQKLGQTGTQTTNKRTGKALKKAKRIYKGSAASLALYKIVNWRRARAGKEPLGGKAMGKAARSVRAASLRSTGFIASGWVYAVRGLARLAGYGDRINVNQPRVSGEAKGYAVPAVSALSSVVTCEIGNTSLIAESAKRTGSRRGAPLKTANRGIEVAMALTAKDMLAHLARKLQPVLDQHSAK